jgi:Putative peptidoglycan binding domain
MHQAQVASVYARIRARDPRALAYYTRLRQCARAGNAKCILALRQLRAYALLQTQGPTSPTPLAPATPTSPALDSSKFQQAAALVISQVQLGQTQNLQAIQAAAQAGNPQGVELLRLVAADPSVQAALGMTTTAGAPFSFRPRQPLAHPALKVQATLHPTLAPQPTRSVVRSTPVRPFAPVSHPVVFHPGYHPPVYHPGYHPGYRPGLIRPGGYGRHWAWGAGRWGVRGGGWRTGWFGWRRPGWRGWGYRPGFGWVWGYPGALIIDASDPTAILVPQADGSAATADPSQVPTDAQKTPDPSTAPAADDSSTESQDDAQADSSDDSSTDDSSSDSDSDSDSTDDSSGRWPWRRRSRLFGRPIIRRRWRDGWPHHVRANTPPPPPSLLSMPLAPPVPGYSHHHHHHLLMDRPAPPDVSGYRPRPPVLRPGWGRPRPPGPQWGRRPSRPGWGGYAPGYPPPGAPGQLAQLEAINDQLNAANPAGDDPNATDASGYHSSHGGFSRGGGWGGWGRRGWPGAGRGYGLWGGASPGIYAPVYAEPLSYYGDTEDLYGDATSGESDLVSTLGPIVAAAGPALAPSLAESISYVQTLGAQAASSAGLNVAQGSKPEEAVTDDSVQARAMQAANQFLKHIPAAPLAEPQLRQAAQIAHAHVQRKAVAGANSAPPAGWTMQPIAAQRALAILGYYQGRIDGVVNQATKLAAQTFQKTQGLTADGIVGARTQPALEAAAKQALASIQGQIRSTFRGYYQESTKHTTAGALVYPRSSYWAQQNKTGGPLAGALAAVKAGIFPALGGLLGGIFGARLGRPKPGLHLPRHHKPRPPAWPQHMVSGADDVNAVREALKKALAGLPLDPGQSEALRKYLQQGSGTSTSSGFLPAYYMPLVRGRDWLGNPNYPYMATGSRIAVGGPWGAALLGAGLYAAVDGYKHGFPHVADTLLGERLGGKVVDFTKRAGQVMNVSGYGHRGWYGRPGTGLPQRMRAGIDTATQARPNVPSPLVESLAASMKRAVI